MNEQSVIFEMMLCIMVSHFQCLNSTHIAYISCRFSFRRNYLFRKYFYLLPSIFSKIILKVVLMMKLSLNSLNHAKIEKTLTAGF